MCTKCIDTTSKISRNATGSSPYSNYILPNNDTIGGANPTEPTYMEVSYSKDKILYPSGSPPWMLEIDPTLATLNVSDLGYGSVIAFTGVNCTLEEEVFKIPTPYTIKTLKCPDSDEGYAYNMVSTSCQFYGCIKNYEASV